jgi:hypothetical protein
LTNPQKKGKIIIAINNKNQTMKFSKESAIEQAKTDLAKRLGISEDGVEETSVEDTEFPDMSLGAPEADEMAAQMISYGWRINLSAEGKDYEYRADKYHLRLCGFDGTNYVIKS